VIETRTAKVDYLWYLYEGQVANANPEGFGRLINGKEAASKSSELYSFVGFFKGSSSSDFYSYYAAQGTGLSFQGDGLKYYGIYGNTNKWTRHPPAKVRTFNAFGPS
jgi:hypothetical protein